VNYPSPLSSTLGMPFKTAGLPVYGKCDNHNEEPEDKHIFAHRFLEQAGIQEKIRESPDAVENSR
jgi:hypothetical protein